MLRTTRGMLLLAAGVCLGLATRPAAAETGEIRVVRQYGIGFLPLMMMEHDHLFETAAKAAGLAGAKATWATLGGPAAANDALLSGSVDVISNGPPSFITMWAKTRGNYDVKGIASMISVPMFLNTSNPRRLRYNSDSAVVIFLYIQGNVNAFLSPRFEPSHVILSHGADGFFVSQVNVVVVNLFIQQHGYDRTTSYDY